MKRLSGKTVLVTGAARGIGRACAVELAREGADVLVSTRSQASLDEVYEAVREVSDGGRVEKYLCDVSDEVKVNGMIDFCIERFGKINCVVNNAAITVPKPLLTYDTAFFDETIRNNLYSTYYVCIKAAKEMVKNGWKGSFVNFSSVGATKPHRNLMAYDTSKAAIESMSRAFALELAPFGIRVNSVAPASILGANVKHMDPELVKRGDPKDFQTPITREGEPLDVAWLTAFLCSDESSFITGASIPIDGGLAIQARPVTMAPLDITPLNLDAWEIT